jgi:SAM-dependent methyltransferase
MMFGTREHFAYFECQACGCLSIQDQPPNLSDFYPADYYSFTEGGLPSAHRLYNRMTLSPLFFLVHWLLFASAGMLHRMSLDRQKRILDVGCGTGELIADLRSLGYRAEGVDPFIRHDIADEYGVRVRKLQLRDIADEFDVVLFHHSLEHMPMDALGLARRRVRKGGLCVVVIPVANWAWKHYGINWVQIDAPRHLVLHTPESLSILARRSGFRIKRIVYDSTDFQFWGSEAYRRSVALKDCRVSVVRKAVHRGRAFFLNLRGLGDQAQFYLQPE